MDVLITGATGFLGGEILTFMALRPEVDKIFCLVRAENDAVGNERLRKVFALHNDHYDPSKIIPVCADITDENLDEKLSTSGVLNSVEIIIHCAANTSFAKIYDNLIEKVNIEGLRRFATFCKKLPNLKTFTYVGTATIIGASAEHRSVYEDETPNTAVKHFVKYTYSKMMGEMILHEILPHEKILVARPSIIMGDTRPIIPRSYVIMWSLAAMNMMRMLPVVGNANLDMIPVDYAADTIVKLVLSKKRKHRVYHVSAGKHSATKPELLQIPISKEFPDYPEFLFLGREKASQIKHWARGKLDSSAEIFQYPKHLAHYDKMFSDRKEMRILFGGLDAYFEFMSLGQVFDNSRIVEDIGVANPEPAHVYLSRNSKWLREIDVMYGATNNNY